jgi:hypothetical protein
MDYNASPHSLKPGNLLVTILHLSLEKEFFTN